MPEPRPGEVHLSHELFGRRHCPFIPPRGDFCPINDLPVELLLRIFQFGIEDSLRGDVHWQNLMTVQHRASSRTGPHRHEAGHANSDGVTNDEVNAEEVGEGTGDMNAPDDIEQTGQAGSAHPFQIIISHVCQHWRHVAISTASLWTSILISLLSQPPYQRISAFLQRSKCLPLDIRVHFGSWKQDIHSRFDATPSTENLRSLYSLLIAHIHRWRSIEVRTVSAHQMHAFLHEISHPAVSAAPQLTSLLLSASQPTGADGVSWYRMVARRFVLFGGSAPRLQRISLERVAIDWNQNLIAHASHLTTLELRRHSEDVSPSWHEFTTILRNASALERLVLQEFEPRGDSNLEMVELPKLTHISLLSLSRSCIFGLFRTFHMPALKDLTIDLSWNTYTAFLAHIATPAILPTSLSIKERPRSLLRSLETVYINCRFCQTEVIEALYDELENVGSLKISMAKDWYPPSGCMPILPLLPSPASGHTAVNLRLPRLETLTICNVLGVQHLQVVRGVMQRRHEAGFPIKALYVEGRCDVDEEDIVWFDEYLETFMFLDVHVKL